MRSAALWFLCLLLALACSAQDDHVGAVRSSGSKANTVPQRTRPDCEARMAEDFVPATASERMSALEHDLVGPHALLFTGASAGIGLLRDSPHEWGQGTVGFTRRLGSAYAQHVIDMAIEHGLAFRLHEDNRYFVSGKNGTARLRYAVASTFLARHDDGARSISMSALAGVAAQAFISRAWQPRSTTSMGDGAVSFGVTFAARAGLNVVREFSPRLLRKVVQ